MIGQNARGKTLILQSSSPAVPDTLFDSSQAQRLQNQLVYTKVVCPLSFYRSFLSLCYRRSVFSAGSVAHTAVADRALAGATAAGVASTAGVTLRGIGTGIQAGQGLIGAARGRTTRRNRQPTDGEQDLASFDASAAPRRPGGVSCQSYDSS